MSNTNKGHLKREIGIIGLLFAAVGSIIGSGWLFGALYAAENAGPASIISWGLGAILMIFIALVYAELGTMFPVSGGVVRYPHFAFGSFASYSIGWITWFAAASTTSIEVLAAIQYATNYIPWMQTIKDGSAVLTAPGYLVAIGLLAIFSLVNFIGIRWFQKLNNALVWWKIAIVLVVIVAFLFVSFHGAHFNNPDAGGFFPFGWDGVFTAISTAGVCFSFLGFRQAVELAGESKNPSKNVPVAVIGSILITAVLYVMLQVAFIGGLPKGALIDGWAHIGRNFAGNLSEVAATFGPLAAIASIMGLSVIGVLLYIDAFISPADTGLIYTTVTSRLSYAMGLNGNAPKSLAKVNKHGVPWVSVILTFVAGTLFFFLFPGWEKIVGFVTAGTVLSFGSGPVALLAMRKQVPKHIRPFKLPMVYLLSYVAFFAANLIVYWSGWTDIWKLMLAVIIGYVVLIIHEAANHKHTPPLEFKNGAWIIVWLVGLTLISYLGSYPNPYPAEQSSLSGSTIINLRPSEDKPKETEVNGYLILIENQENTLSHSSVDKNLIFLLDTTGQGLPHITGDLKLHLKKGATKAKGELTGLIKVHLNRKQMDKAEVMGNIELELKNQVISTQADFVIDYYDDHTITPQIKGEILGKLKNAANPGLAKKVKIKVDNTKKIVANTGVIPIGWDIVIFALFSLFIVWLAEKSRLPSQKAQDHIEDPNLQKDMEGGHN